MARDWASEAAVVMDALLQRGRADWPGVGCFRIAATAPLSARFTRFMPGQETELMRALGENGVLRVDGFGEFRVMSYPAWEGRDPRSGEQRVAIEAKRALWFRPHPELQHRLGAAPLPEDEAPFEEP